MSSSPGRGLLGRNFNATSTLVIGIVSVTVFTFAVVVLLGCTRRRGARGPLLRAARAGTEPPRIRPKLWEVEIGVGEKDDGVGWDETQPLAASLDCEEEELPPRLVPPLTTPPQTSRYHRLTRLLRIGVSDHRTSLPNAAFGSGKQDIELVEAGIKASMGLQVGMIIAMPQRSRPQSLPEFAIGTCSVTTGHLL